MNERAVGIALCLVWLLNYVDGVFTVSWVQLGLALEANPLMAGIVGTPTIFILAKTLIVSLSCWLLWRLRAFALSRWMILVALICYTGILFIHTEIALSLEEVPYDEVRKCLERGD